MSGKCESCGVEYEDYECHTCIAHSLDRIADALEKQNEILIVIGKGR